VNELETQERLILEERRKTLMELIYHAPEVPDWYPRREMPSRKVVPAPEAGSGYVKWEHVVEAEPELQRLVRWRIEYARAVLEALLKQPEGSA